MIIYKGHFYRTAKDLSDYIGKTWESPEGTRSVVSIMNPPSRHPMLAVKTEGLGGSQLYTLDDLEFEIKRDTKNLEYRTKIERERTNREVEEQKEREFLDQYLATISSPKTRGKASAILMRPATINGESDLRYKHMEDLVNRGYTVTTDSRGRRVLEAPGGSFFFQKDITKTAMDYAEFLLTVL